MNKRVILLRSNPVSPDPPVEKIADTLIANDYKVLILGWDRSSNVSEMSGELLLEHGKVEIIRLGVPAIFDGGIKKNLVPLAKFQNKLFKWLKKHKDEFDIIHAFDFDTGFISNIISKKYNKTFIYHILDFYIDSHNIPNNYLKAKIKNSELSIINDANATIICSEKRCEQINGSKPKRLEIIHNTPKSIIKINERFNELNNSSRCKIVYVGILAGSRFLKEIIKFVMQDERFEFHIGGFGIMENEIVEVAEKCERIFFYGKIPYDQTLSLEQACDIMTAIYDPKVPNHKYAAPNKFYESLMLGKPIVMARNTGFDKIIEDNNIGCLIEYNEKSLFDGLNRLIDYKQNWNVMSEKMKHLYNERFSWNTMEKRLMNLYKGLCHEKNINC